MRNEITSVPSLRSSEKASSFSLIFRAMTRLLVIRNIPQASCRWRRVNEKPLNPPPPMSPNITHFGDRVSRRGFGGLQDQPLLPRIRVPFAVAECQDVRAERHLLVQIPLDPSVLRRAERAEVSLTGIGGNSVCGARSSTVPWYSETSV